MSRLRSRRYVYALDLLSGSELTRRAQIVEDYDKQLQHLKKECDLIKKDYTEWVNDHPNFKEQV